MLKVLNIFLFFFLIYHNNNIPSIFPQVLSGEGGVYTDLTPTFVGREEKLEVLIYCK